MIRSVLHGPFGAIRASARSAGHFHLPFLAVMGLLLVCGSLLGPVAASAHSERSPTHIGQGNTGDADTWDGQFFDGFGGTARGPFSLHGGRYYISVHAFYNDLHTTSSSCSFTAHLEGVEHDLPPAFANLGTAVPVSDSGIGYDLSTRIIAPAGHYSLIVSPFTNCDWRVTILGGIPAEDPLSIGPVGISHSVDGVDRTITVVPMDERVDFSMLYAVRDTSAPTPNGSVSLIQRGKTVRTYPISARAALLGLPELHRLITFGTADRTLLGPLTARFSLALGATHVTRSFDFTLTGGGGATDSGALVITDVGVFSKVGDRYPPTKVAHLSAEAGFTVTYRLKAAGAATPTGSLSLLQHGKVVQTFPLKAITMDDGQTGFYTIIHWDPADQALLGPLTARATVTVGTMSATRSADFTLAR